MPGRGNAIRAWRKARGFTLEQLAGRLGTTDASLSRIERGLQPYSQGLLESLADALKCEPADLVSRQPPSKDDLELWTAINDLNPDQKRQAVRIIKALSEAA